MSAPVVGFVGAGRIGRPMVERLLTAGHRVRVSGRSGQALAALGAQPVAEPAAVARSAQVVCVCVHNDPQVQDVLWERGLADAMEPGSALVLHTTGSPATTARLTEHLRERDVEVVDAPVSGTPADVAAGEITLFVGATRAGYSRVEPVLNVYAAPVLHLGEPGDGQRVKLINNALFTANIGLLAQAVRTGAGLGINEQSLLDALRHGSGSSYALLRIREAEGVAAFADQVGEFVGKDVGVVRSVAAESGVTLGVFEDAARALGELLRPEHRALLFGTTPATPA
jgi:3-hydroxyisobutyrate dehydrogenase-like beta-hydroxyacid dehydrogenase